MVHNNEVEYFIPGSSQEMKGEQALNSQSNYKDILKCF